MIVKFKITAIKDILSYLLLFLMIFVPFEQKNIKIVLLILIIISVIVRVGSAGKVLMDSRVFIWLMLLISTGLFFVLWGTLNGYDDSLKVLPVFVIWPIAYFFIIESIVRLNTINNIFMLLVGSAFIISIYSILYMLSMVGIIPSFFILSLVKEAVVSVGTEFFSYGMPSITSMFFLVPFTLSAFILWVDKDNMPIKRIWLLVTFILSLGPVIFSSTRMFWILLFITPILTMIFIKLMPRLSSNLRIPICINHIKNIILSVLILATSLILYFYNEVYELIKLFFDSSTFIEAASFTDRGSMVRVEQMHNLINGWFEVPLLGAGHGASLSDYRRSELEPWAYEQTFFALLFQTGLIGTIAYFLEILWIFFMGLKIARKSEKVSLYIIPSLVGTTCFLVANSSNPYLYAFDHLWTLFVTVIVINVFLLEPNASAESLKADYDYGNNYESVACKT